MGEPERGDATAAGSNEAAAAPEYYRLSVGDVTRSLDTDMRSGLTDAQANARLADFGPNSLPAAKKIRLFQRLLGQLHNPLIYVLLAAGAITAFLGEIVDSSVIFGVVAVNAVIGLIQESKAEAELESLRSLIRTDARVVRGGQEHLIPSEDLVPGDLVRLAAGDKVPADLRLTRLEELQVDESALTGESLPVVKSDQAVSKEAPVADRLSMAYSGTLVTSGEGQGIACATGPDTEMGHLHRLVGAAVPLQTPLTAKLAGFSRLLSVGILALAAVAFAIGLYRGNEPAEMFTAAVALAVGAIPEGLPAAVTITLAIGVARMARRRAVIRHLPAVETLGSTTVICSDKTGTLTENQMTVQTVWTPDRGYEVTGSGLAVEGDLLGADGSGADLDADRALRWTLLAGSACGDAALTRVNGGWSVVGDPTEGAMLIAAAKAGLQTEAVDALMSRAATIPFSSERQYMAGLFHEKGGGYLVLAKGAAEKILDLCNTEMNAEGQTRPLDRETAMQKVSELADKGMRVLATAVQTPGLSGRARFAEEELRGTLVFTGIQAMVDPHRATVPAAITACHTAGISVKMITGDHGRTAAAIAAQVGLVDGRNPGRVLTGADLASMPESEAAEAAGRATVFARVAPEQKLRLVEALQARGHIVAMTGDGVNDAPALRRAGIGIAMGSIGTDVAKDAADMVLTDDDFSTIEAAVEEGRGVFDNLVKFIAWTLPTNVGEGMVILAAILFGTALPILPTQILWINMTTAVALGLMLAFEPKEKDIMSRPPRDPARPLLTRALVMRTLLVSGLLVAGSWGLFHWELAHGADLAEARTAAMNVFVVVEAFYLFNCRSMTSSAWRVGLFSNKWLLLGLTIQAACQMAITYLPAMNTLFRTAPLKADTWLLILATGLVTSLVVGFEKRLRRLSRGVGDI
ncbi:cation-translocating P-type ATPase [Salininema proteolyticum]|uniref:Cation-translocating P-type ATPase n=1 Tax=Salininema proteolyticum TaxID=1607685 RepID=A0ABV8U2X1_9ACTN